MKILVDQDQVLCDWKGRVVQYWNEDTKENVDPEKLIHWDTCYDLGIRKGSIHFVRSVMRHPDFYTNLEPLPGAVEAMKQLKDWGHELRIVSSVPKQAAIAYHGKLEWLRKHMPWFKLDDFVAMKNKHEHEGDVLIDDGMHNIAPWTAKGRIGILFDASYNRDERKIAKDFNDRKGDARFLLGPFDWSQVLNYFAENDSFLRDLTLARERGALDAKAMLGSLPTWPGKFR